MSDILNQRKLSKLHETVFTFGTKIPFRPLYSGLAHRSYSSPLSARSFFTTIATISLGSRFSFLSLRSWGTFDDLHFTICRIKLHHATRIPCKQLSLSV